MYIWKHPSRSIWRTRTCKIPFYRTKQVRPNGNGQWGTSLEMRIWTCFLHNLWHYFQENVVFYPHNLIIKRILKVYVQELMHARVQLPMKSAISETMTCISNKRMTWALIELKILIGLYNWITIKSWYRQ